MKISENLSDTQSKINESEAAILKRIIEMREMDMERQKMMSEKIKNLNRRVQDIEWRISYEDKRKSEIKDAITKILAMAIIIFCIASILAWIRYFSEMLG